MRTTGRKMWRAVSPVIATLLLIAIAVAAGIILYVFVSGFTGSLTQTGGQQAAEQLALEAYDYRDRTKLSITIRNTGGTSVLIDKFYIDGSETTTGINSNCFSTVPLTTQSSCTAIFYAPAGPQNIPGSSHIVKVVTKTGGIFTFTVIVGRTG
jgi:flagellin-like protein